MNIFKSETPIVVCEKYNRGKKIKSIDQILNLAYAGHMFYHYKLGVKSCKFLSYMPLQKVLDLLDENELYVANKI